MKTLPHRNELMKPTVQAIQELGGSGSVEEILEKVVSILAIPDELAGQPYVSKRGRRDPRTQLEYDLAWARTYLRQLGILENSERGVWALTGKALNADLVAPRGAVEKIAPATDWHQRITSLLLDSLSPSAFERLIQRVLRETGFVQVEVTGRTGDGGIDGIGIAKINGILSFRVVFQCKRRRGGVGAGEVRDFRGAMQGRADKGLLVTTGSFTRDALKEATRDGAIAIDLMDGQRLTDKLKELGLGVKIERTENVTVDEEWFKAI
jgi:restriction system protein